MTLCSCDGPPHTYDPGWCSRLVPTPQAAIECRLCGSHFHTPAAIVKHVATTHPADPLLDGSGGEAVRTVTDRPMGSSDA